MIIRRLGVEFVTMLVVIFFLDAFWKSRSRLFSSNGYGNCDGGCVKAMVIDCTVWSVFVEMATVPVIGEN